MLRLDINIIFTFINIFILYIVVKKFLLGPVNAILAKRKETIEGKFEEADITKQEALSLKEKYEVSVSGIEEEKKLAASEARKDAMLEYERIVSDAQNEADKILVSAKENAQADKDKVLQKAKAEISDMVIDAAAKVMGAGSNADSDKKLYEQFLAKAGDSIE